MWTSVLNPEGLAKALSNLKPGSSTIGYHYAAEARQRIDWHEGLNLSRIMTIRCVKGFGMLSVGRVQTPTLGLLVAREEEIENFTPRIYFELSGKAHYKIGGDASMIVLTHAPKQENRIYKPKDAEALRDKAEGAKGPLQVKQTPKKQAPPPLFNLATIGKAASTAKSWGAKKTLDVAQSLYENHKATSYPRTDCSVLDPSEWDSCQKVLSALTQIPQYKQHIPSPAKRLKRSTVFNAKKMEGHDHHGLIPTTQIPNPSKLSPDEKFLYKLITERFISQFMPDTEYLQTVITMDANGVLFSSTGRVTTFAGFKAILGGGEEVPLPQIPDKTPAELKDVELLSKKTKPPPYYTEGSLVERMGKLRLGTQATWAAVIETLKSKRRNYAKTQGKYIRPTDTGMALIRTLRDHFPEITSAEKTAKLEENLDLIQVGKLKAKDVEATAFQNTMKTGTRLRTVDLPIIMQGGDFPTKGKRTSKKTGKKTSKKFPGRKTSKKRFTKFKK